MASQPIYQFHAQLNGFMPPIWRRFQVSKGATAARLGYIVMTLFEMRACHMFCLEEVRAQTFREDMIRKYSGQKVMRLFDELPEAKDRRFVVFNEFSDDFDEEDALDAAEYKMHHLFTAPGDRLRMRYDYGDDWQVDIVLEAITEDPELPGRELPRVLEGEGWGIIEDCGGTEDLMQLSRILSGEVKKPASDPREWLDNIPDSLSRFDIDDMNFRLKKLPRIFTDIYEYDLEPTQHSVDIIERRYLADKQS